MKTIVKIILMQIFFICCISMNAKSQDWLTGGNPLTGVEVLGSTTAFPLNFITSNTQKATILANGNCGIGLSTPQSLLHLHQGTNSGTNNFVYTQWTNFNTGGATPAVTNGLLMGIDANGIAQMMNQETGLPIEFWLNAVPLTGGTATTTEKMRIITEPRIVNSVLKGSTTATNDRTRVGIWRSTPPWQTYTAVSMLHIGDPWIPTNLVGGFRDWMDVGTYYNIVNDNMYVGMRDMDPNGNPDHTNAVISWGNNPSNLGIGDRLTFLFTAAIGNGQASTNGGLEISRMWSDGNVERMGIGGDPAINLYSTSSADPQNTLEINSPAVGAGFGPAPLVLNNITLTSTGFSGLRFTDLTSNSVPVNPPPANKVLSLTSDGDVILIPGSLLGGPCTNPSTAPVLTNNWEIPLNSNNFVFSGEGYSGGLLDKVGIGTFTNLCDPIAKLDVLEDAGVPIPPSTGTIAIQDMNHDIFSTMAAGQIMTGLRSVTDGTETVPRVIHIAGNFYSTGAAINIGGRFNAQGFSPTHGDNLGVQSYAGGNSRNVGGSFIADGGATYGLATNFGVFSLAFNGTRNTGIYAYAPPNPLPPPNQFTPNLAGLFNGDVFVMGNFAVSDKRLKIHIDTLKLSSSIAKIKAMHPISFDFDTASFPSLSLPRGSQIGLTAQEIQTVYPNMVRKYVMPAQYDSIGDMIYDTLQIKSVSYTQLIPLALAGIKELDSVTTALSNRNVTANNGLTASANNVHLGGNLIQSTTIGLNSYNLTFSDGASPVTGQNKIIIGPTSSVGWAAKLKVVNTKENSAGTFVSNAANSYANYGINGIGYNGAGTNVGGEFKGYGSTYMNFGVNGNGDGPQYSNNYGGMFIAGASQNNSTTNYGINSSSSGGDYSTNFGVYAEAYGGDNSVNYGVYATATIEGSNAAGYMDGDLVVTGTIYNPSDATLKENIAPVTNAMDLLNKLNPKTYNFKTAQNPALNLPSSKQYGLIAQDLANVLPELTKTIVSPEKKDTSGNTIYAQQSYTGINYIELIPVIIAGVKEQQQTITTQQNKIDSLITIVAALQHATPGAIQKTTGNNDNGNEQNNYQVVELASENSIILNQNDPNPFAEQTDITYYLPETISNAKIMFYDITGKVIKSVELIGTGNGTLHVYASNLSSGTYMYSLVADGKTIDSKKMVCTKK